MWEHRVIENRVPLGSVKALYCSSLPLFPNMTYRDILLVNKSFTPHRLSAPCTSLQQQSPLCESPVVEGWSSPRPACGRCHVNEELLIVLAEHNKPAISAKCPNDGCGTRLENSNTLCFVSMYHMSGRLWYMMKVIRAVIAGIIVYSSFFKF